MFFFIEEGSNKFLPPKLNHWILLFYSSCYLLFYYWPCTLATWAIEHYVVALIFWKFHFDGHLIARPGPRDFKTLLPLLANRIISNIYKNLFNIWVQCSNTRFFISQTTVIKNKQKINFTTWDSKHPEKNKIFWNPLDQGYRMRSEMEFFKVCARK